MTVISKWIFSLICCGLVCALFRKLFDEKSPVFIMIRILCGIYMLLTVGQNISIMPTLGQEDWLEPITQQAQEAVCEGVNSAQSQLASCITEQTQTYILEKAQQLRAAVTVQVRLSSDSIPIPVGVTIMGDYSPYARQQLQAIISEAFGISGEDQTWIGSESE